MKVDNLKETRLYINCNQSNCVGYSLPVIFIQEDKINIKIFKYIDSIYNFFYKRAKDREREREREGAYVISFIQM